MGPRLSNRFGFFTAGGFGAKVRWGLWAIAFLAVSRLLFGESVKASETPSINEFCDLRDGIDAAYGHLLTNQAGLALAEFDRVAPRLDSLARALAARKDRPVGDLAKLTNRFPVLASGDSPVVRCRKLGAISLGAYLTGLHQQAARTLVELSGQISATRAFVAARIADGENQRSDSLTAALDRLQGRVSDPRPAEWSAVISRWSNERAVEAAERGQLEREMAAFREDVARLTREVATARSVDPSAALQALAEGTRREDRSNRDHIDQLERLVASQEAEIARLAREASQARDQAVSSLTRADHERDLRALKRELARIEEEIASHRKAGGDAAARAALREPTLSGAPLASGPAFQLALLAGLLGMGALTLLWRRLHRAPVPVLESPHRPVARRHQAPSTKRKEKRPRSRGIQRD
ncbi:MAG: hypothetical protein J0L75_06595 [Spirochaetes bacterium]|nr:hypothetical protein [Spirochaetota bacterium]